MSPPALTPDTAAGVIARFLKARGVDRIFALCGGHIMPIWMRADAEGIRIIDVRDEVTAVFAADATARLTGIPGVAAVTAPVTASRAPLLPGSTRTKRRRVALAPTARAFTTSPDMRIPPSAITGTL